MGVIVKKEVRGCMLGIWEIKEDFDSLFSRLKLDADELETLGSFKNESRKIEWLSVRVLINEMTGKDSRIIYNQYRKPFLKENSFQISISHSKDLTSILMSKSKKVGIDLEYMSHKISNVSSKFINNLELITTNPDLLRYHLYIHWCAKEAMYKICDKQDINFKENLSILPFDPKHDGWLKGRVLNIHGVEDFNIRYENMDGYAIAYTCK
ncbi:MAG: 4'-phosphopantetheinyl transferase superfamily protein [Bacteroidales bacterium]|nr:4'-phosphopantetheinyl transferase superfamily protein [Bacteroidales bacterium]MCB9013061.1 4'-phosphopantetheinyl transferase superfamily protein [Bacteroidales bacterium]